MTGSYCPKTANMRLNKKGEANMKKRIRAFLTTEFSRLGGGNADIELTNKEDLLNCGVEISVLTVANTKNT